MWKVNGRRTPSDGKSSHCLWQGELKMVENTPAPEGKSVNPASQVTPNIVWPGKVIGQIE